MLPKRKSVPRSSRQVDHTKTSWPWPVHQVWPKLSCEAQWKGEEDKAARGRGGKTTSGNGQAWSLPSPRGQWRTGEKWRKLVAKSSVVPQWPSWLREWWWWWWMVFTWLKNIFTSSYTPSIVTFGFAIPHVYSHLRYQIMVVFYIVKHFMMLVNLCWDWF